MGGVSLSEHMANVGILFVEVDGNTVTGRTASGAHFSYTVRPGANGFGHCENSKCERHGRPVLDPKGCRTLDLQSEEAAFFCCPACDEAFELENVYFYKCSWTTDYQIRGKCGKPCDPPGNNTHTTSRETVSGADFKKFGDGQLVL